MRKTLLWLPTILAFTPVFAYSQVVNWTTKVKNLHVSSTEVKIVVDQLSQANPSGSVWGCTSNLVSVGTFDNQISTSLKYSAAMEAYKSNVNIRIGVRGSGTSCTLEYITLTDLVR